VIPLLISRLQYDYDLMAKLTGNTAGTLKKYVPKVKTKAIAAVSAFGNFINGTYGDAPKAPPAANKGTKRKAEQDADANDYNTADINVEGSDEGAPVTENKVELTKKKVAGKGKGQGKKAANHEDEASAEGEAEQKKPAIKKPRGKVAAKTKSDDETQENGDDAEEAQEIEPAVKKPRGKAGAKKMKPDEKAEEEADAKEKEEKQVDNEA
jgi:hypothetical protein